jgi:hypothetical protein
MIDKKHFTAITLLRRVAAISVLGNLLGVALTFVYFGVLMPRLLHGSQIEPLGSTVGFFLVFVAFVTAFSAKIIWPLIREVKGGLNQEQEGRVKHEELEGRRRLVGKLMKLPVNLAGITLAAWILAALA